MNATVEDRIADILVEQLGVKREEILPAAKFDDDFGMDSLDSIETVMAIEEAFGIEIPDEDVDNLTTVQDLINYTKAAIEKGK